LILVLFFVFDCGANPEADAGVRAAAFNAVEELDGWLAQRAGREGDKAWRGHCAFARLRIERMRDDPASLEEIAPVQPPPGAPIGTTY
jgi:hypothetical protein